MRLARIPTETGAILYDPARIDHPHAADFEPAALERAARVRGSARGRGSVWFIAARSGDGEWVLRHYRRGGLVAKLCADRYWWRGEDATRPFRELRLLAELEAERLPAVRPVAARYQRTTLGYRADLLTAAVPGAATLAQLLATGLPDAVWRSVGATIRRFHAAGICHADLNAHNVLIADGAVRLVDFDRGTRRAAGPWQAANLARLKRSLDKLAGAAGGTLPAAHWDELVAGYELPRSVPPR